MFFLVSLFFATTTCIDFWVWRQLDNDVKNAILWAAMTNEFYRCDWYNVFHLSHECSIHTTYVVFLMFVTDWWFSHSYAGNLDSIGLGVVGEAIRTFDLPKYLGHKYFIFLFTSRIEVSKVCFCSNLSVLTSCYITWFKILQSKRNFTGVCSVWFSDCISASMLYADLSDFTLLLLSSQLDLFNPI